MKFDLNQSNAIPQLRKYDACVVGAGAAGITLAIYLAKKGKTVALLEGGGMQYSQQSQDIYDGESIGYEYWNRLQTCRLRFLGGTTNHWSGRCMTLQPIDFEKKEFMKLTGWPINKEDLDLYLGETLKILDVNATVNDVKNDNFSPSSSLISAWAAQSAPTRFGQKYLGELTNSPDIDLYINANVTDIKLNENTSHVNSLTVKNYEGNTISFEAQTFILAAGAIENAKTLLNCDSQMPNGIGNQSDFVGRCFMEHLNVDMGRIVADLSHPIWKAAKRGQLELFPSDKLIRDKKIGSGVMALSTSSPHHLGGRLKKLKEFFRDSICSSETTTDLSRKLAHFNCPGDGSVTSMIEQEPNRMSRLFLDDKKDALGLRRSILDWQISDFDRRSIKTLAYEVAKEVARLDIARMKVSEYIIENQKVYPIEGHCHQMGTTRMATNEKDGVVDENCKVFGIDNLYISGSSIFPTGGGVNPTLSIVQLALRLVDEITAK